MTRARRVGYLPSPVNFLLLAVAGFVAAADARAQGYDEPYGQWRGQAQYQAIVRRVSDPAAHAVVDLVIDIDARGKVTGASTENGCHMLGIAQPGLGPNILNLNVTLRSCGYAGFNRIYRGYIALYPAKKYATLSLQAVDVSPGSGGATFTIESTMRR